MSDSPKSCGTCRWWERRPDSTKYGDCVFEPLPESVTEAWFYMLETAGKDCPCHAPREASSYPSGISIVASEAIPPGKVVAVGADGGVVIGDLDTGGCVTVTGEQLQEAYRKLREKRGTTDPKEPTT